MTPTCTKPRLLSSSQLLSGHHLQPGGEVFHPTVAPYSLTDVIRARVDVVCPPPIKTSCVTWLGHFKSQMLGTQHTTNIGFYYSTPLNLDCLLKCPPLKENTCLKRRKEVARSPGSRDGSAWSGTTTELHEPELPKGQREGQIIWGGDKESLISTGNELNRSRWRTHKHRDMWVRSVGGSVCCKHRRRGPNGSTVLVSSDVQRS